MKTVRSRWWSAVLCAVVAGSTAGCRSEEGSSGDFGFAGPSASPTVPFNPVPFMPLSPMNPTLMAPPPMQGGVPPTMPTIQPPPPEGPDMPFTPIDAGVHNPFDAAIDIDDEDAGFDDAD